MEADVRHGYTSGTSNPCHWNEIFSTKVCIYTVLFVANRNLKLTKQEQKVECERIVKGELKMTQEEADYLQQSTRLQAQSLLWFAHRKGRITASKFGAVCQTSVSSPSKSLVDSILQRGPKLNSEAVKQSEPLGREQYKILMASKHSSFQVQPAGLFVNPQYPYLGASPDGVVSCQCCGEGIIEIKCPYSLRDSDPNTITISLSFLHLLRSGNEKIEILAFFRRSYYILQQCNGSP